MTPTAFPLPSSRVRAACAAACLALAAAAAFAQAETPSEGAAAVAPAASTIPVDDGLYRALGGQPGIDRIVEDFVPRLVADPRMSEFFKHTKQPHLVEMLAQQFCQVAGGGCAYTGKSMAEAHQDMDISKADFNALVEVLQASMAAQGVPFATQNRLLARLAPMHRDMIHVH